MMPIVPARSHRRTIASRATARVLPNTQEEWARSRLLAVTIHPGLRTRPLGTGNDQCEAENMTSRNSVATNAMRLERRGDI